MSKTIKLKTYKKRLSYRSLCECGHLLNDHSIPIVGNEPQDCEKCECPDAVIIGDFTDEQIASILKSNERNTSEADG